MGCPKFGFRPTQIADLLEDIEPSAYIELGIKPWELGRWTPYELEQAQAGLQVKWEREEDMLAWLIAWVVNGFGTQKKKITVERILGRKPGMRQAVRRIRKQEQHQAEGEIKTEEGS